MKKLIFFLPIFYWSITFSQNSNFRIDSLSKLVKQSQDPVAHVNALEQLGNEYAFSGRIDSLRIINTQMLKIASDVHNDSLLARTYFQLGLYCYFTSDYKQQLDFDFKGLNFAEKSKSGNCIWFGYKEVGAFYKELKNYPDALKYLKKAKSFLEDATVADATAPNRTYTHLAETFLGLGESDSALHYIQLTNEVTSKTQDPYGFARMLYIFARIYKTKGDADIAESYYKKCIAFSNSENIVQPYITGTTGYGQYLFNAKQFALSKQYGLSALKKSEQSKNKSGVINAAVLLREAYYAIGQKDSSYYFSKMKDLYSDSVFNEQQTNQIQNISIVEQIKEREKEAAFEELQHQRRQNIQFILIAFCIIIFIILFLLFSRSIVANEKLISFFAILGLLIIFEFINLLIHPWLAHFTNESPVLMLLALVLIAALLIPLHHRLEHWIKEKMVEKNKAIRLAAAKKTIEKFGDNQAK